MDEGKQTEGESEVRREGGKKEKTGVSTATGFSSSQKSMLDTRRQAYIAEKHTHTCKHKLISFLL